MATRKSVFSKKALAILTTGCLLASMTATGITPIPVQAAGTTAQTTSDSNEETAVKNGWDGSKYYKNGAYVIGWQTIDGKKYYFDKSTGVMKTYTQVIDGKTYYFDAKGVMQTGWIKYNATGKWRYFGSGGAMLTGWQKVNNKWYYLNPSDGYMMTGWKKIGDKWYYFGAADDGVMKTGWQKVDNKWYYLDASDGYMYTDWQKISGKWYYFGAVDDGVMKTGWQKVGNNWYYLDPTDGYMYTGWQKINNKWYYLGGSEDGIMKTGWQKISNKWYYFGGADDGVMKTGWQKVDNKWYYLDLTDGYMYTGWHYINGKWYSFNTSSGIMATLNIDKVAEGTVFDKTVNGSTAWLTKDIDSNFKKGVAYRIISSSSGEICLGKVESCSVTAKKWVSEDYIMINLPDVEPNIIYQITNADGSIYKCHGKNITGLTGYVMPHYRSGKVMNNRLGYGEYVVPVLYSTAKKIAIAERKLEKDGYVIKIYDGYRPHATTLEAYAKYSAYLSSSGASTGWAQSWFLAKGVSSHNTAAAVDVTLVKKSNGAEVTMPTKMHELTSEAGLTNSAMAYNEITTSSYCNAVKNNTACMKMHAAFTSAGLNELASEWWHFEERAGYNRVKSINSSGLDFTASNVVSATK